MNRIAVIAITVFALSGCASGQAAESAKGSGSASASTAPSPPSVTADPIADEWSGKILPNSTWTKTLTLKQAKKAGVPRTEIPSNFGEDGLMPMTFAFEDDAWAIIITNDQGRPETGDLGTLAYDDQGRLVTTSNSEGAAGVVIVLDWEVAGDTLTIRATETTGDALGNLVLSGQWARST